MKPEIGGLIGLAAEVINPNGQKYATLEANRGCNRSCGYCAVPSQYDKEGESSLGEVFGQVDWLHSQGFRLLSYIGGEPLAPMETKEGITFAKQTEEVVKYASKKGMAVNVTSNGDYLTPEILEDLKKAGLDTLTLSLHTYTEPGVRHIVKGGRAAAKAGIIPVVNAVFTSDRSDSLPGIAATMAENGLLFSTAVVQEKGGGFSTAPDQTNVPSMEEKKKVFDSLLRLKSYGFVRNNKKYLQEAPLYDGNTWTCNPEKDAFIQIGAGGKINVCSDVRTGFNVGEIDLTDGDWREAKRALVSNCGDCLYSCYFEAQNQDTVGDIPTLAVMGLIKTGNASMAERWGKFAVNRIRNSNAPGEFQLNI